MGIMEITKQDVINAITAIEQVENELIAMLYKANEDVERIQMLKFFNRDKIDELNIAITYADTVEREVDEYIDRPFEYLHYNLCIRSICDEDIEFSLMKVLYSIRVKVVGFDLGSLKAYIKALK